MTFRWGIDITHLFIFVDIFIESAVDVTTRMKMCGERKLRRLHKLTFKVIYSVEKQLCNNGSFVFVIGVAAYEFVCCSHKTFLC